jgi:hypothetical protein
MTRKINRDDLILSSQTLRAAKNEIIKVAITLSADKDLKSTVKELKDQASLLNISIDLIDDKYIELDHPQK